MTADIVFLVVLVAVIAIKLYNTFGQEDEETRVVEPKSDIVTEIIKAKDGTITQLSYTPKIKPAETNPQEFNHEHFINGARKVFEIVVKAFDSGDLSIIKDLVSKKVYDAFKATLDFRKENNLTSEVDFICFDKSEIKEVKQLKNSVKVVVEFVTEQVNLLKNDKGEVIEGDENFVQKITDVWTFERTLNAKDNNWTLVSTKKTA